jgi:hypothetical protein
VSRAPDAALATRASCVSICRATGPDPNLEPITWDEWFKAFDENGLAFLYEQDDNSRFYKLVSREREK